MEEKQVMTNTQLEAALRGHRSAGTVFRLLTYAFGLGTILLFAAELTPVAVVTLVLTFVFGYQMSKHGEALKKLLGDNIVSGALNEVFENVEYKPFGCLPSKSIEDAGMVFPFEYSGVRGSDYVKETQQWKDEETQVFKGQWLVCDFGKELSGQVHLSANAKALRRQHRDDSVEMENAAFNDRFLVTAASAQEAYYLLTPHMMEYILSAAGKAGGEVYMAFLRGGRLHVAVKTGRDFFELGRSKADVDRLRQKFLGELHWFTGIMDELRLADTLYRKETQV